MALLYNLGGVLRKSHKYDTSDRRKTTTNYDKYGYEVTALGSSSITNGKESATHVLRVQPGLVVNFIETPPPSRNRHRSWTAPRVVEYKSSLKGSHSHPNGATRDSFWKIPHMPHHGSLEPVNNRKLLNSSAEFGQSFHRDPHSSPTTHHYIPDEPFPELHYPEPHYQGPCYPKTNHMEPHLTEMHRMEPHYPESHYPVDSYESPPHAPSPIDIPLHSHPSDYPDYSLQSPSIPDSDLTRFNHVHSDQMYDTDHCHSPDTINDTIHIPSSPRSRRHSFDFPIPAKPPSSSSSNTRTVHFRDDPVLPSPPERRKGWWNRRGDQLWDNNGSYVAAPEHDKYPSDLRNYPEAGVGWMSEAGVQIDMKHYLVRKKPLRSALKKSSL